MPAPITTTSAEPGSLSSLATGCTGGDIGQNYIGFWTRTHAT
jgi:hypothetical protein